MAGIFSAPKPAQVLQQPSPPPPKPVTPETGKPEADRAEDTERRRLRALQGANTQIATSRRGLLDEQAPVRKSLLGQ